MSIYKNYGTVNDQKFVEEFRWKDKIFYSYLIQFNEYEGYFRIIREEKHEQALIGAKIMFNYSYEQSKIDGYRIIGYASKEDKENRIKELLEKRRNK